MGEGSVERRGQGGEGGHGSCEALEDHRRGDGGGRGRRVGRRQALALEGEVGFELGVQARGIGGWDRSCEERLVRLREAVEAETYGSSG